MNTNYIWVIYTYTFIIECRNIQNYTNKYGSQSSMYYLIINLSTLTCDDVDSSHVSFLSHSLSSEDYSKYIEVEFC